MKFLENQNHCVYYVLTKHEKRESTHKYQTYERFISERTHAHTHTHSNTQPQNCVLEKESKTKMIKIKIYQKTDLIDN